jgi:diguanylate cyclase
MKDFESQLEREAGLSLNVRVRADRLQLLYHQSLPAVYTSLIVALLLSLILWGNVRNQLLIGWLICILISVLMRAALFWRFNSVKPGELKILDWERPYAVTLFIPALIWGLGVLWIMTETSQLYQVIAFIFLLGMAGGSISLYSARRYMAVGAMVFVLLPATLWMLFRWQLPESSLGVASLLFMGVLIRASHVLSSALGGNFRLAHRFAQAKLNAEQLAQTDFLTGLDNRRAFFEHGQVLTNYCERNHLELSVVMIDADHFKQINDVYGHSSGDAVLQHLANLLKKSLRKSDVCGRMGGEEFAILLPDTPLQEAASLAERFCHLYATSPTQNNGTIITNTVSIGVSSGGYDIDHLLHCADQALYRAKTTGRNRTVSQTCDEIKQQTS